MFGVRGLLRSILDQLSWEVFQPKLAFNDLDGYWYRALVGRARRGLPREASNVSVGGMRAEL